MDNNDYRKVAQNNKLIIKRSLKTRKSQAFGGGQAASLLSIFFAVSTTVVDSWGNMLSNTVSSLEKKLFISLGIPIKKEQKDLPRGKRYPKQAILTQTSSKNRG